MPHETKQRWLCVVCTSAVPRDNGTETPVRGQNANLNITYSSGEFVTIGRGGRSKVDVSPESPADTCRNESYDQLLLEIREMKLQLNDISQKSSEIELLRKDVQDLRKELHAVTDSLNLKTEKYDRKLQEQDSEIASLKNSLKELQKLQSEEQQNNLGNVIEITGVPEQENENLIHLIMLSAKKIGVDLAEGEVDSVSRAGPVRVNKASKHSVHTPRPIVVKLLRRSKRDAIIKAARLRKNVTSDDVVAGTSNKLFFNERLTKERRHLFRDARTRAKQYKFQYCWVRNGAIFVRRADQKPAILIRDSEDLDAKVGPSAPDSASTSARDPVQNNV